MPADCDHDWVPLELAPATDAARCRVCGTIRFVAPEAVEYVKLDLTIGSPALEERVKARPPPDAAEAIQTLREFAAVDVDEIEGTERFAADPWQYFRDAMVGLQVVVRAHLEALDAAPRNLFELALQILLEAKAKEYDASTNLLNGHEKKAEALRDFARFLRDRRGGGTSEGT